ncbi:helix-turn-helix domain-containing protein [Aequorivita viscosa]|uniref:Helix-turn-helix domain-containing protein n=1 Tax=Aequorivita viscosa TaxID=797419 RepID=A0A1M6KKU3_9FLAO|nr:helix-turn-helix domain-containing protein [Aequorivita viscosa]SDX19200.1 Helix-turn-helix domain-containing protein [Aequorivita viscosa]SHJ59592.1 Helix-turn-helix domain-containing protein [Aequorivita viscosa]
MTNVLLSPIEIGNLIDRIATRTAELIQTRQTTVPNPADDLITPKEACELLQCTPVTLWRWEKKGRVTPYGIGGKKFFKRSELLNSIVKK